MRSSLVCRLACLVALLSPLPSYSQKAINVPRSDGHETPLLIYEPVGTKHECAPLAVISHGAGGSERAYQYLANTMSQHGYLTVVMGHRESGFAALRAKMRQYGMITGLFRLVKDKQAEEARLQDVGAALKWADSQCRAPFRVLLGHSMGGETVMLEAGAKNMIDVSSPPAGQDRFDAYVALSAEGPGAVFPEHAWTDIHKPILILTGTKDQALVGGPKARQLPFYDLPADGARKCHWMGIIDDATHMNFAGNGEGADTVTPVINQTIAIFLSGVRGSGCTLPKSDGRITLQAK